MPRKKAAYTELHREHETHHEHTTRAYKTHASDHETGHTHHAHEHEHDTSHTHHTAHKTGQAASERKARTTQRSVKDVMTPRVVAVTSVTFLPEAAQIMRDEDVGALPVVQEDGHLLGIITDRDIAVRAVADAMNVPNTRVAEIFTTEDLVTVTPETILEEAAELMSEHQVRRLPVVEEGNRLVGMVSLGDLAVEHTEQSADVLRGVSQPGGEHTQGTET